MLVRSDQVGDPSYLRAGSGGQLEQHVARRVLDVRERRDDRYLPLLGQPEDGLQLLLVDRADDQVGFADGRQIDDLADAVGVALRVVERDIDRASEALHAVETQQETLVELEVVGIRRTVADRDRQQQRDAQRLSGAQRPELDRPVLSAAGRSADPSAAAASESAVAAGAVCPLPGTLIMAPALRSAAFSPPLSAPSSASVIPKRRESE